jgi:hypothetical protein
MLRRVSSAMELTSPCWCTSTSARAPCVLAEAAQYSSSARHDSVTA